MAEAKTKPVPTIGRIVHYTLSEQDVLRVHSNRSVAHYPASNGASAGQAYPAVIVRVWGDTPEALVNLQVLLDGPDTLWVTSVAEGDGAGKYAWPTR